MPARSSRIIDLPPELDAFVAERLASGAYDGADEVVRAALRLMRDGDGRQAWARASPAARWPVGGGECGALVRSLDWSETPLGASDGWSAEMRAIVATIVNSPVAKVLMWGPHRVMLYNDGYRPIAGDRHPAALGSDVSAMFPEVWNWNRPILERGFRGETSMFRDQAITFDRGGTPETVVLDLFYTPVHEADGTVGGVMCTMIDNSRRVELEARLAAREAELRRVTDAVPMLVSYVDRDHVYRFANQAYEDWFGVPVEAVIGRTVRDVLGDEVYRSRRLSIDRALAGENFTSETTLPRRAGGLRSCDIRYVPHVEDDGTIPGVYVLGIDTEERAEREAALAVSNSRFRTAMDAMHGVLWTNTADGRMRGEQPGWAALTGQSHDAYQDHGWADAVHPDDVAGTIAAWERAVAARAAFVHEHRVWRHGDTWRTFAVRALPILTETGEILEWVGVHTDITHQRIAEAALRAQAETLARQIAHRERAEHQLRQLNETLEARVIAEIEERRHAEAKLAQAQKMESIGKLTGGVAHDFNNLLQVVSGNLQLLGQDVVGDARAEKRVANALAGVSRGAKLAAQLLAFGRRQALEPKVVNATRFVRGMDDMLRRAIGAGIEIETVVENGLWNTFIDPAQIENALLNLAINARDAMGGTGRLTIELTNAVLDDDRAATQMEVAPGHYVVLAVTDTGCGMTAEVLRNAFEPFFSTKGEGKGSGLGLSMVYGFVRQSGGHVRIYSEVGEGTTVRLYLPRATEHEAAEIVVDAGPVMGGTETVLVVEDDQEVRATVVEMLDDLGYHVLTAVDAADGLAVVESGARIDILFTDVVMPGTLKSPEMARRARELLPDLVVLFTSGYTENSIVHGGKLDRGVDLLSKPYTREALARRLRQVVDGQRRGAASATAAPVPAAIDATLTAAGRASGAIVLLVEDEALIRHATAEVLQRHGMVVVEAGNAEDAVEVLRSISVDLLVSDINLPGASGIDLGRQARSLQPAIGIVFATGDVGTAGETVRDDALVLAKPYGGDRLLATVRTALARRDPAPAEARDPETGTPA